MRSRSGSRWEIAWDSHSCEPPARKRMPNASRTLCRRSHLHRSSESRSALEQEAAAHRLKLEKELEKAQTLLDRARSQVVELQMARGVAQEKVRRPGARRTESAMQTDPTHDEAVKRELHDQLNEREQSWEEMRRRMEDAEEKLGKVAPRKARLLALHAELFDGQRAPRTQVFCMRPVIDGPRSWCLPFLAAACAEADRELADTQPSKEGWL